MRKVHQGVRGKVTNANGDIVSAVITVEGNSHKIINSEIDGWYYRPLPPGDYVIECSSFLYPGIVFTMPVSFGTYENTRIDFMFPEL